MEMFRNTVWNLCGQAIPLLAALVATPFLIAGLGIDRFGVLALALSLVGYFGLFDFGLGRALTKLVAERLVSPDEDRDLPSLLWTALVTMAVLGVIAALVLVLATPKLVNDVLRLPDDIRSESIYSFRVIALSMPFVIVSTGLRGILEAQHRFGEVNAVRAPLGVLTYLGPLLALSWSPSLVAVNTTLLAVRLLNCLIFACLCFRSMPCLRRGIAFNRAMLHPLLSFGGWLTVSSVVAPFMLNLDRFLIGAVVSVSAVAYYTTPFDVVTKLWIIPTAVLSVMYPAFSSAFKQDPHKARHLYTQATLAVACILLPLSALLILFALDLLTWWVGADFAKSSYRVAQVLAFGTLINSLALVSSALVQTAGRPDLTAKLHLVELPLYLAYLWPLAHAFGIIGVALAWLIRVSLSAIVLRLLAMHLLNDRQAVNDIRVSGNLEA